MKNDDQDLDLFGLPRLEPKDPRGRPKHKRTIDLSRKIAVARAMGRTVDEIGVIVGLDPKTMRKYYPRELEQASELVQAVLDEAVFVAAIEERRTGAQRLLQERLDRGRAAIPLAKATLGRARPAPKAPRLGKKAQALVDAKVAHHGTSWGDVLKH